MRRRRYQRGSIEERGGFWVGRWRQSLPGSGTRQRRLTLGSIDEITQEEARARLSAIIAHDSRQTHAADAILGGRNTKMAERVARLNRGVKAQAVGAAAESLVTADLLMRGFEVFSAVHNGAGTDLIAVDGTNFYKVEVKAAKVRTDGRADCSLKHNWGKFDILAVVSPDPAQGIIYRSHAELDQWSKPLVGLNGASEFCAHSVPDGAEIAAKGVN